MTKKDKTMTTFNDEDFILGMQSGYIECAEWADNPSNYDDDTKYEEGNGFSDKAIKRMDSVVEKFYYDNKQLLIDSDQHPDYCGHDLWLTQHGHGAGFWDRGLEEIGDRLTEACKKLPHFYIYANKDGILEVE